MTQRSVIRTYQVIPVPILKDKSGETLERYIIDNLKRIEVAINNLEKAVASLEQRVTDLETP